VLGCVTPPGRPITVLEFNGPRFEDHGPDVDVLPEILAFKRLLQEAAKELWRRKNPDGQRLPRHFDEELSLKFFAIKAGSAGVALVRATTSQRTPRLPFEDELDEAASLLQSAGRSERPPSTLPRSVIPLFQEFGRALRPDEFIIVKSGSSHSGARYDDQVKTRIMSWVTGTYTDRVELIGEVRGTV